MQCFDKVHAKRTCYVVNRVIFKPHLSNLKSNPILLLLLLHEHLFANFKDTCTLFHLAIKEVSWDVLSLYLYDVEVLLGRHQKLACVHKSILSNGLFTWVVMNYFFLDFIITITDILKRVRSLLVHEFLLLEQRENFWGGLAPDLLEKVCRLSNPFMMGSTWTRFFLTAELINSLDGFITSFGWVVPFLADFSKWTSFTRRTMRSGFIGVQFVDEHLHCEMMGVVKPHYLQRGFRNEKKSKQKELWPTWKYQGVRNQVITWNVKPSR